MWLLFFVPAIIGLIFPDQAHADPVIALLGTIGTWIGANAGTIGTVAGAAAAAASAGTSIYSATQAGKDVKPPPLVQAPTAPSSASETTASVASLRKRRLGARGYNSSIIGGLADAYRPELKSTFGG